ncbi:hypothetical protein CPIN18021_0313 [Campylobacter pinnipediorum subsp. caledonicus]|uniref:Uncharacterized protein n=1 Tax=Campylobacter pinnipediorum subsp. caledonicus TaxID=1874362 RepID=A0A1S6U664_9BACT|nr:hypothetical protein [Campylobacter pinnipediorum]AQW85525.1 hypothetical protein CPIN18020_0281 [Campylobacter pinnipediorum subsp. caledonicus]AQW87160.1 hypothetical protein CPIN18021_0313 [Campylobacter pinnipediorum subsp. caledonicus]OPA72033.1 hypothetical protein BB381_00325 [Campylobacter pinnipediorum subsp. caledonicus]
MPVYKVTQQQGNRVITSTYEAKSSTSLLQFLQEVSTAKVKYIYRVEYEDEETTPPNDDFNYHKQFKAFAKNSNNASKQVLIHNVKTTKNEQELTNAIITHLSVGEQAIKSVACSLFMH